MVEICWDIESFASCWIAGYAHTSSHPKSQFMIANVSLTTRYYQHLLNKWCLFFRVQWLDRTHWLNPRSQMDVRIFLDIGALQSHCSPHELHIKTYQNLKEKTIEIHRNPHIPGVPRLARKCIQVQWHLLLARILRNHPWLGKHGGSWGWFFFGFTMVLPTVQMSKWVQTHPTNYVVPVMIEAVCYVPTHKPHPSRLWTWHDSCGARSASVCTRKRLAKSDPFEVQEVSHWKRKKLNEHETLKASFNCLQFPWNILKHISLLIQ